jgi:hypothetical protein
MTELAKRATQTRRMTLDNRALRKELSDGTILMKKLIGTSPERLTAHMRNEIARWTKVAKAANMKID